MTIEEIIEDHPHLKREDILAALDLYYCFDLCPMTCNYNPQALLPPSLLNLNLLSVCVCMRLRLIFFNLFSAPFAISAVNIFFLSLTELSEAQSFFLCLQPQT